VLDEDDGEGGGDDDELLVDAVADSDALLADDGGAGEFSALEVAGAVVVGDGVGVVVPVVDEEPLASSPSVVVPEEDEVPTSAETGFCPISSIPVTIAIATTNTETA
jgi:hypothetical protein